LKHLRPETQRVLGDLRVGAGLDGRVVARPALRGQGGLGKGGSSPLAAVQTRPYEEPEDGHASRDEIVSFEERLPGRQTGEPVRK